MANRKDAAVVAQVSMVGHSSIRCMFCEEWHPGMQVFTTTPGGEPAIPVTTCYRCIEKTKRNLEDEEHA